MEKTIKANIVMENLFSSMTLILALIRRYGYKLLKQSSIMIFVRTVDIVWYIKWCSE